MLKTILAFLLIFCFKTSLSFAGVAEWKSWVSQRDLEFRSAPESVLATQDIAEIEKGGSIYLAGGNPQNAAWKPGRKETGALAVVEFDGNSVWIKPRSEGRIDLLQTKMAKLPNGMFVKARPPEDGRVRVYLFNPASRLIKKFHGLHYFKYDPHLVFEGNLERLPVPIKTKVELTNADRPADGYIKGIVRFKSQEKEIALKVIGFTETLSKKAMIAFKDDTNAKETYGAGRYLDVNLPEDSSGRVTLDFNYAYHPYCAYVHKYTCMLIRENKVPFPVRAGERLQ